MEVAASLDPSLITDKKLQTNIRMFLSDCEWYKGIKMVFSLPCCPVNREMSEPVKEKLDEKRKKRNKNVLSSRPSAFIS